LKGQKMAKKSKKPPFDHGQCECVLKQRGPHWGLYCLPHNHFFKWLNPQERAVIKQMDIGMIYQTTRQSQ
jgi:hypothetical protein